MKEKRLMISSTDAEKKFTIKILSTLGKEMNVLNIIKYINDKLQLTSSLTVKH